MMEWKEKKILAVVPARGGSKGIPKKNLSIVGDKTLIGHAAAVVKELPWLNFTVLSTDDNEIKLEGIKSGLNVPFLRPIEFSSDISKSVDMWRHALLESEKYFNIVFDYSILLEPTSPFRIKEDIEKTISTLVSSGASSAITLSRTPAHYTPNKTIYIENNGRIKFYLEDGHKFSLRQTIPNYYHKNGICYAIKRDVLINPDCIIENNSVGVIIEREVVNIDSHLDLKFANFLFSKYPSKLI